MIFLIFIALFSIREVSCVCDGNPHNWDRKRRCDGDHLCPGDFKECGICEGIGGIPNSDDPDDIRLAPCTPIALPGDIEPKPEPPLFPKEFMNDGFYEVQIYVRRDPLCFAQVPAMISNGTHCYKPQQGAMYYSSIEALAMMDYLQSRTVFPGVNMSYHFYHESQRVHPDIYKYGLPVFPDMCPCINVSAGIFTPDWARDARYVGRELMEVEFLWQNFTVDHWVKGPHHAWVDAGTNQIIRLYQPWNGLEVFDPEKYHTEFDHSKLKTPLTCDIATNLCINPYANYTDWIYNICEQLLTPIHLQNFCNNI